jgi:hypothetical protein
MNAWIRCPVTIAHSTVAQHQFNNYSFAIMMQVNRFGPSLANDSCISAVDLELCWGDYIGLLHHLWLAPFFFINMGLRILEFDHRKRVTCCQNHHDQRRM